jgi:uncharacterized protein YukE
MRDQTGDFAQRARAISATNLDCTSEVDHLHQQVQGEAVSLSEET